MSSTWRDQRCFESEPAVIREKGIDEGDRDRAAEKCRARRPARVPGGPVRRSTFSPDSDEMAGIARIELAHRQQHRQIRRVLKSGSRAGRRRSRRRHAGSP